MRFPRVWPGKLSETLCSQAPVVLVHVPVENLRPQTKTPFVAPVETGNQNNRPSRATSHVTISLIFRRLGFSLVPQFRATGATSRASSADNRNAFE